MISDEYHKWYENNRIWEQTKWLGVPMWKLPFDAFVVQELIMDIKPDYIIETGTGCGGSSIFYATILEILGKGMVFTIDIDASKHQFYECQSSNVLNRIMPLQGSSTGEDALKILYENCIGKQNIVLLDSWHSYDHVLEEMRIYKDFVPRGSYLIVEDTHVNGHPIEWEHGDGPYEAVQQFLKDNDGFVVDRLCEKYEMTFNPSGYLRRVK